MEPIDAADLAEITRRLAACVAPLDPVGCCLLCRQWQPLRALAGRERETAFDQSEHARSCPWRLARELVGLPLNLIPPDEVDRMGERLGASFAFTGPRISVHHPALPLASPPARVLVIAPSVAARSPSGKVWT